MTDVGGSDLQLINEMRFISVFNYAFVWMLSS